jgi:hypothetical protein
MNKLILKNIYSLNEFKNEEKFFNSYKNKDLKMYESADFSNKTNFSASLLGRAINSLYSIAAKNAYKAVLLSSKTKIENELFAGVLRVLAEADINASDIQKSTEEKYKELKEKYEEFINNSGFKHIDNTVENVDLKIFKKELNILLVEFESLKEEIDENDSTDFKLKEINIIIDKLNKLYKEKNLDNIDDIIDSEPEEETEEPKETNKQKFDNSDFQNLSSNIKNLTNEDIDLEMLILFNVLSKSLDAINKVLAKEDVGENKKHEEEIKFNSDLMAVIKEKKDNRIKTLDRETINKYNNATNDNDTVQKYIDEISKKYGIVGIKINKDKKTDVQNTEIDFDSVNSILQSTNGRREEEKTLTLNQLIKKYPEGTGPHGNYLKAKDIVSKKFPNLLQKPVEELRDNLKKLAHKENYIFDEKSGLLLEKNNVKVEGKKIGKILGDVLGDAEVPEEYKNAKVVLLDDKFIFDKFNSIKNAKELATEKVNKFRISAIQIRVNDLLDKDISDSKDRGHNFILKEKHAKQLDTLWKKWMQNLAGKFSQYIIWDKVNPEVLVKSEFKSTGSNDNSFVKGLDEGNKDIKEIYTIINSYIAEKADKIADNTTCLMLGKSNYNGVAEYGLITKLFYKKTNDEKNKEITLFIYNICNIFDKKRLMENIKLKEEDENNKLLLDCLIYENNELKKDAKNGSEFSEIGVKLFNENFDFKNYEYFFYFKGKNNIGSGGDDNKAHYVTYFKIKKNTNEINFYNNNNYTQFKYYYRKLIKVKNFKLKKQDLIKTDIRDITTIPEIINKLKNVGEYYDKEKNKKNQ